MLLKEIYTLPERYDSALIISDTHVGLPGNEIFQEDFEAFINHLASNPSIRIESDDDNFQIELPKLIILLGDFLDFWDGRLSKLPGFSTRVARVLSELADVLYLRGNHDYIVPNIEAAAAISKKFEICEDKLIEIGGKPFYFIHGHQFMSAFGPTALKLETYINPYYTMMEGFFSRFTIGHGRHFLAGLTLSFVILGLLFSFGQILLTKLSSQLMQFLWSMFGLLFPVGFVTIWRVAQKKVWKFFTMIFGELINSLRGAARGDTIEYLTSPSKPISRWFEKKSEQSKQAKEAGFVVFGHTHIPEGPMPGDAESLTGIEFLNTGSWMKHPSKAKFTLADKARTYTRLIDKFDEYLLIVIAAMTTLTLFTQVIPLLPVLIAGVIMLTIEVAVVLGKSSYRRLPNAGLRSLAFIGKDTMGAHRVMLLYWDPTKMALSASPIVS